MHQIFCQLLLVNSLFQYRNRFKPFLVLFLHLHQLLSQLINILLLPCQIVLEKRFNQFCELGWLVVGLVNTLFDVIVQVLVIILCVFQVDWTFALRERLWILVHEFRQLCLLRNLLLFVLFPQVSMLVDTQSIVYIAYLL